ncbi:MAG: iron-containing redox enzyme family protein [Actinomycetales bacterium]|nr:iron-containing redox enzyme family protein [Actinomycetales bacterium]
MVAVTRRPEPRGPLSERLLDALDGPVVPAWRLAQEAELAVDAAGAAVLDDDDVQLSLTVLYELHYRGVAGVDDRWEWSPDLVATRLALEEPMEQQLRDLVGPTVTLPDRVADVPAALFALTAADSGPSLSAHLARRADRTEFREFLVHRSLYHLKEADPHTWAIPRLSGAAKAALVEIQADEYGGGRPDRMHATLFATAMRGSGLDDEPAGYLDLLPAVTLGWANTMSLFGLNRRLRGALAGHLAALEMTSSLPNARYARGVRRLGLPDQVAWFFDEHVEADAVHEQVAAHDLAGRLVADEPRLLADVFFGAAAALATDARVCEHLLSHWAAGRSSLRDSGLSGDSRPIAGDSTPRSRRADDIVA